MLTMMRSLLVLGVFVAVGTPVYSQRRSDVITAAEIDTVLGLGATAYDAVRTLRPRWLRTREPYLAGRPDDMIRSDGPHVYLQTSKRVTWIT